MDCQLIRHTPCTLSGRACYGHLDAPLPDTAAESIAQTLQRVQPVDVVFTSPLQRCFALASQLAQRDRCPLVSDPDLRELDFGEWEGLTWQEIQQRWPNTACRKVEDWLGVTAPGGETWIDFCARVDRALEQVLAGPRPAAVVAHMVVNAALAARILQTDPKRFHQDYGEILTCDTP
jgi:broad specificity phosphatase PhoE